MKIEFDGRKYSQGGRYWFRVKYRNGQVCVTSETYTEKRKCEAAARRLVEGLGGYWEKIRKEYHWT